MKAVVRLRLLLLLVLVLLPGLLCAREEARGRVFEDRNGNGQLDRDEPGIAGVLLSNGRNLVATDSEGRYRIALNSGDTLFLVKPRDHAPPVDAQQLPRFFYHHFPEGSPPLAYGGIAATGPLPEAIDFPLQRRPESEQFQILVFADPQANDLKDVAAFRRGFIEPMVGSDAALFGLSLGDLTNDDLSLFEPLNESIGLLGVPWYNVYGNHDMDLDAETDGEADHSFRRVYGPASYAFQVASVHFLVLDNVIHWREQGGARYIGGLTEDQFQFLAAYLERVPTTERVVLAMHIPLSNPPGREAFRVADRERLFNLLARFPNTLSLSGHSHIQRHYFFGPEDDWQGSNPHHHFNVGAISGSWWSGPFDELGVPYSLMRDGTPPGYARIDFDGSQYQLHYRVARRPADYQMQLHAPQVLRQGSYPNGMLWANVFIGHAGWTLRYRIDDGAWRELRKVAEADPTLAALVVDQDRSVTLPAGRRLGDPLPSDHLWRAALPTDLALGRHRIEVQALGPDGEDFRAFTSYRLER